MQLLAFISIGVIFDSSGVHGSQKEEDAEVLRA